MDAKTLKALEGSIKKWEKIVARTGFDNGCGNCPLCRQFLEHGCVGCPVVTRTGKTVCKGTPYSSFAWKSDTISTVGGDKVGGPHSLKAAKEMLAFLKRLRPRKKAVKRASNAK